MKKLYFLTLCFLIFISANSQIVTISDANFKSKLLQASSSNPIASTQSPIYFSGNLEWLNPTYNSVIDTNGDGEIQLTEAQAIKRLDVSFANISDLSGIAAFSNLEYLKCSNNQLTNLNVSTLQYLKNLECNNNQLTNLNIGNLVEIINLVCYSNELTSLNVSNLINLKLLQCASNQINNLETLNLLNLVYLDFNGNQLTNLNTTNLNNLTNLYCGNNQLTNLNISNLINLVDLICSNNYLTILDVSNLTNLLALICNGNLLTTLDVSNSINLDELYCNNNQLTYLNIKNNNANYYVLNFDENSNLQYICADENDITLVQNQLIQYGYTTTCNVNTYCSFNPGGTFYTIIGNNRYDSNNNGCDVNDLNATDLKFNITSGTTSGTFISNALGNYSIPLSSGTHTFTPQLENPNYFTISPTNSTVTFPTTASPFTQNFCLTANGVNHDLEIVIVPVNYARPGFDATYKLKYRNKGNQVENATLVFNYDDSVLDLVSTSVAPTSQNTGVLNWNLGTLNPFQQGEILFTLNLNYPTENPPLNSGSILNYTALINGLNTDESPIDNHFTLNQTVVNSHDPNDKRCLEGTTISPSMIGQYVHYMIRFENTGTFPAGNIVVKDMIDLSKFDISTLQMTDASHSCYTRINGNKVEFIFENINLDFNDATNDGYVVFKIKTKSTLTIGSQITNNANIYFDYNFPIVTNTATSTFQALSTDNINFDNYFTVFPNPAKDILNIKAKQDIEISSVTIYTMLGQIIQTIMQPSNTINVSDLKTGNYFLKVTTEKGTSTTKFIKD